MIDYHGPCMLSGKWQTDHKEMVGIWVSKKARVLPSSSHIYQNSCTMSSLLINKNIEIVQESE